MASRLLPTIHRWLSYQVKSSTTFVHQLQKLIHPNIVAFPFRVLTKCSTSLFFMCLFLPFLYLNIGLEIGRHVLLIWCASTYVTNFLKDLLMVPRISRHDPTIGLYRSLLLRRSGSRGFGIADRGINTSASSSSSSTTTNTTTTTSSSTIKRGSSGSGSRSSGSNSNSGGGGSHWNSRSSGRSFSCCNYSIFSKYNASMRRYNFTDDVAPSHRIDMIRHSWGLPSLSPAITFAVLLYLLYIYHIERFITGSVSGTSSAGVGSAGVERTGGSTKQYIVEAYVIHGNWSWFVNCLLLLFCVGFLKVVSGEDSPPSVAAGWLVGVMILIGCWSFGKEVDNWLISPRTTTIMVSTTDSASLSSIISSSFFQELLFISVILPSFGIFLLMCYPVPYKYNSGGTYPQTAVALGYCIGGIMGIRLLALASIKSPSVPSITCAAFMNGNASNTVESMGVKGRVKTDDSDIYLINKITGESSIDKNSNNNVQSESSPCAWSWLLRTILSVILACSTFIFFSSLYVYFNGVRTYYWRLFRPRLSANSKSILKAAENSEQRHLFTPLSEAETIVRNLTMSDEDVPEAAVLIKDSSSTTFATAAVSSSSSSITTKRDRKTSNNRRRERSTSNSISDGSDGGGRSPSISNSNFESDLTAGVHFGTFESSVPFNYISTIAMGMMTTFVGPYVVSSFGG